MRGSFQHFGRLSILGLAGMFYTIYIKKIFDWRKYEKIRMTISSNSKEKPFIDPLLSFFNHLLGFVKYVQFFRASGFSCQPRNLVALYSSSFLAGDLQCCSLEMKTQFLWHSLSATLRPVFRHEIRR